MNGGRKELIAVAIVACVWTVTACTGFYVGRGASADGTTLLGRTVDVRPWTACFRTVVVPGAENRPGRKLVGLRGFEWELPATTYRYVCTPAVSSMGKGFFASGCVNEKGLGVTGTVTGYIRKEIGKADPYVAGGAAEENLPGLLAACCATAREAVELLGRVIAEKGNSEPNIYMFADWQEAWYVETYTGHQWAAVRLPEDGAAVFGNRFMLRGFDPASPDSMSSPGIVSMPEKAGLAVRDASGKIDLFCTYGGATHDYSNLRTWYGRHVLAPAAFREYVPEEPGELVFSPERKVSPADIFSLMRSRYEGTKWCPDETGDKGVRVIGTTKQATSHVIVISGGVPPPLAANMWVSHGPAEHSVFIPISAASEASAEDFARDFEVQPFRYERNCAAAEFRRLAALAEIDRRLYGDGVRRFWELYESGMLAAWANVLKSAAGIWSENRSEAERRISRFTLRAQNETLGAARALFDELMWCVTANNRIDGDVNGGKRIEPVKFSPPTKTTMPIRSPWPVRERQKLDQIGQSGGEIDLVFVGDSITHNWENEGRGKRLCEELQRTYSILNLGFSGNRTENVIWRLENGELDGYRAKLFMVMIGTNNSDPAADVAKGIRRILDLIRSRQPQAKILLLPIFPRGRTAADSLNAKNMEVNRIVRGFTDGSHVKWCDFNAELLNPEGGISGSLAPDHLHPNEEGYAIWLRHVLPHFRHVCGK